MSKRPAGSGNPVSKETVLSLYLPAIVLALGTGIAAPAIPVYAKSFDISFATASLVIIVHGFGMVASTFPTGYLIDRIGRRPVLIAGPLLTAFSAIMTAFAGSFPELLAYRFLNGAAAQMWNQSRLAMIADTGSDRERGRLITWMMSVQRFGMLFAPAIGGFTAAVDIRLPFILHGVLVLLVLLPSLKYAKETAPDRSPDGKRTEEAEAGHWSYVFAEIMRPQMLFFLCAQLLANLTRGNMQNVLTLYVAYAYSAAPETIGLMNAANSLLVLPIGFATGYIMDRFGRKKTIVPGFSGLFVSACLMAATAYYQSSFELFLVTYFLMNASQGITSGNMQVLGSDLAPARARGRFFAIWRLIGEVGGASSPLVFTWLAVAISYAASFTFLGFCGLGVALIIGFKVKETVRRELPVENAAADARPNRS